MFSIIPTKVIISIRSGKAPVKSPYTNRIIAFLGFALIAENWWIALLGVLALSILAICTRKEEANLIERFGDEYRAYMQRTGRYLPMM